MSTEALTVLLKTSQFADVNEQQDAQECWAHLLYKLARELLHTVVTELFGLQLQTTIKCREGSHGVRQVQDELMMGLHLEVPADGGGIESSLHKMLQPEELRGEDRYDCGCCNRRVDADKGTGLTGQPEILSLHLKRFHLDTTAPDGVAKLHARIAFPAALDITPYLSEETTAQVPLYHLAAVIVHDGTASFGHNYAYIRGIEVQWFEFSDERVRPIQASAASHAIPMPSTRLPHSHRAVPLRCRS